MQSEGKSNMAPSTDIPTINEQKSSYHTIIT